MKNPIKNQNGSVLAYVLIFSVIIMVLVVGLLTVAQSGISFTQQTVESRQAYIDAKSVIEYGKIEITERGKWLEVENGTLEDLYDQLAAAIAAKESTTAIRSAIDAQIQKIHDYMTASFYIGGVAGNVVSTVSEITDETSALGVMSVTEESDPDSTNVQKLNYIFDIQTQNLRRSLDYQTSLNYTQPVYSDDGSVEEPTFNCSDALATQIKKEGSKLACVIQKEGNDKEAFDSSGKSLTVSKTDLSLAVGKDKDNPNAAKFDWIQGYTLNLTAKNLCFVAPFPTNDVYQAEFNVTATDTIRVREDYIQNNNDTSKTCTFEAQNIVFDGDLTLNNNANLKIKCKNLWIKGDINIDSNGGTESLLEIEADNIYIGDYANNTGGNTTVADKSQLNWICTNNILIRGDLSLLTNSAAPVNYLTAKNISIGTTSNPVDLTVKNATKVIWDCENFWLHGDITTITSSSYQEFNNIVYFQAGNINLSDKCTLKINGKADAVNQIFVDGVIPKESNDYTLSIRNFQLFRCNGDFGLNFNSDLDLEADYVQINGDLSLSYTGNVAFKTDYLDVQGKTSIYRTNNQVLIDGLSNLKVRFADGYEQTNSTVIIKKADATVFGGNIFKFGGDGVSSATLNIASDAIFIDTVAMSFTQYWAAKTVGFNYIAKNGSSTTDLSLKSEMSWKPENTTYTIEAGKYNSVSGNFPTGKDGEMLYEIDPSTYSAPSWTNINITLISPQEPSASGSNTGGTVSGGFITNGSEKYY
ncbi:hypothetical protein Q5O14_01345 [Eubacteriaceae bacterium ES2]|nr:hypothetical protein Q5O14_01345 [Eubacteriaceae bacterium ES2]